MTHQGDSPDALPPYVSARVDFLGDGGDFLKMMFKGAGLQLVTLGFYRFWFFTNIRRSLWADTSVRGDTLEYTGRGRELLIGFLFALAILAPFYVLYFLAGLAAESWKAWASLPLFAAFYLFGQFAIFRARRYRLTRTIWRGVRFWMTGSGLAYMVRAAGWTLLTFVTLGAALPWREAALERYKMRHTHYGDLQGRFEGTGWELFKSAAWIWAVLWLLVVAPWIYIGAKLGILAYLNPGDKTGLATAASDMVGLIVAASLTPLLAIVLWPLYVAIEWRWWLDGLRIGEVEFSSTFPRTTIFLMYLAYAGVSLLVTSAAGTIGGLGAYLATPKTAAGAPLAVPHVGMLIFVAILYLLTLACLGAFYRYFLQFKVWQAVMESLTIHKLGAAWNVRARGGAATALGEGLADGLDVAGF